MNKLTLNTSTMSSIINLEDLGAIGDGITDCTEALYLALNNYDYIYIPNKIFNFIKGDIIVNKEGHTVTIFGNGTLLFTKEDSSCRSYDEAERKAHYIFRIENADNIIIKDVTIKAVTNMNNFDGTDSANSNPDAVYFGSIWGIWIYKTTESIILNNIRVLNFNYRGIAINDKDDSKFDENDNIISSTKKLLISNCYGSGNKGSGYWITNVDSITINGGEFCYNGIKGQIATGYGITVQTKCQQLYCIGAYFHHNYRKGLDSHGCNDIYILSSIFEDNLAYDIGITYWRPVNLNRASAIIKNCIFISGKEVQSRNWMLDCYKQVLSNKQISQKQCIFFNNTMLVHESNELLSKFHISECDFINMYNGWDIDDQNASDDINSFIISVTGDDHENISSSVCIYNNTFDISDFMSRNSKKISYPNDGRYPISILASSVDISCNKVTDNSHSRILPLTLIRLRNTLHMNQEFLDIRNNYIRGYCIKLLQTSSSNQFKALKTENNKVTISILPKDIVNNDLSSYGIGINRGYGNGNIYLRNNELEVLDPGYYIKQPEFSVPPNSGTSSIGKKLDNITSGSFVLSQTSAVFEEEQILLTLETLLSGNYYNINIDIINRVSIDKNQSYTTIKEHLNVISVSSSGSLNTLEPSNIYKIKSELISENSLKVLKIYLVCKKQVNIMYAYGMYNLISRDPSVSVIKIY